MRAHRMDHNDPWYQRVLFACDVEVCLPSCLLVSKRKLTSKHAAFCENQEPPEVQSAMHRIYYANQRVCCPSLSLSLSLSVSVLETTMMRLHNLWLLYVCTFCSVEAVVRTAFKATRQAAHLLEFVVRITTKNITQPRVQGTLSGNETRRNTAREVLLCCDAVEGYGNVRVCALHEQHTIHPPSRLNPIANTVNGNTIFGGRGSFKYQMSARVG